ncbi:hypothetical protein [Nocardioides sp.]|uniref:hypothetical protein n=1 Tax=Nocardioides sp. TaxID=35761 RepID=UPI00378403AE
MNSRVFDRYLAYIHRTGLHTELEAALRPTASGRPRALRTDVLLAGMLATFNAHQSLALTTLHATLTTELDRNYQRRLGIRDQHGTPITLRQVRYLWSSVTDLFEHTPARRTGLDVEERAMRAEHLQDFLDRLLGAATDHIGVTGRYAVDGTAIESAARGKRRPRANAADGTDVPATTLATTIPAAAADGGADLEDAADRVGRSADCDAAWGYRTRTYDNKTNLMFGYQMLAFTRVGAVGEDQPLLTERIAVVAGNNPGISETLDTLDRLQATAAVTEVIADRGFSYKKVEDWATPLRDRGVKQVLDLHENDHGARVHPDHGYVMVDGWAHCPSIPDRLVDIARPARFTVGKLKKSATREERAEHARRTRELADFNADIAERATYRFEPHGKTKNGSPRFICPARAGKLKCAACPLSQLLPDPTPEADPDLDQLPTACKQATITIPVTVEAKVRQEHYWGSPEWQKSYGRRVRVEGAFGLLKSAKSGGVRRGWTYQVGLVKTTLLLGIAVAATNINQLLTWARRTGNTRDPLTTLDVTDHGFVELAPGADTGGTDPPVAA